MQFQENTLFGSDGMPQEFNPQKTGMGKTNGQTLGQNQSSAGLSASSMSQPGLNQSSLNSTGLNQGGLMIGNQQFIEFMDSSEANSSLQGQNNFGQNLGQDIITGEQLQAEDNKDEI